MKCDGWNNKYLEYLFCTLFALAASFGFAVDGAAQESASILDWLTAKERGRLVQCSKGFGLHRSLAHCSLFLRELLIREGVIEIGDWQCFEEPLG